MSDQLVAFRDETESDSDFSDSEYQEAVLSVSDSD